MVVTDGRGGLRVAGRGRGGRMGEVGTQVEPRLRLMVIIFGACTTRRSSGSGGRA